jgi:hypothetical protein
MTNVTSLQDPRIHVIQRRIVDAAVAQARAIVAAAASIASGARKPPVVMDEKFVSAMISMVADELGPDPNPVIRHMSEHLCGFVAGQLSVLGAAEFDTKMSSKLSDASKRIFGAKIPDDVDPAPEPA